MFRAMKRMINYINTFRFRACVIKSSGILECRDNCENFTPRTAFGVTEKTKEANRSSRKCSFFLSLSLSRFAITRSRVLRKPPCPVTQSRRDLHNFACDSRWKNYIRVSQLRTSALLFSGTLIIVHHFLWQTSRLRALQWCACVNLCSGLDIVIRGGYVSRSSRLCNRDYKTACHLF